MKRFTANGLSVSVRKRAISLRIRSGSLYWHASDPNARALHAAAVNSTVPGPPSAASTIGVSRNEIVRFTSRCYPDTACVSYFCATEIRLPSASLTADTEQLVALVLCRFIQ